MKILHVSPAFFPAVSYGGPIDSLHRLANTLARAPENELRVLTTDTAGPRLKDRLKVTATPTRLLEGYEVFYCKRRWALSSSPELVGKLPAMIRWADIVHLTAVYSFPTIPTLAICKLLRKPVVWSPRGALQRWEKSSRPGMKRLWDAVCNLLCDKERVTLHFTSEKELAESAGRIKRAASVAIPNGVEMSPAVEKSSTANKTSLRLLYLGRLHPIKGIENLLGAMRDLDQSVTLSICGNGDNGYEGKLKALAQQLDLGGRVSFNGHVTDEAKSHQFANADVLVMPSFSESFGVSVAEALSHGLPVIAGTGTPWSDLETRGCGLWVDNDPSSLTNAINRIREMPLKEMGLQGQQWMAGEFSWSVIGEKMLAVYKEMVASKRLPEKAA